MDKNGVIAVVVVVISIVLVGLWAMRSGERIPIGANCSAPPDAPTGLSHSLDADTVTINWEPSRAEDITVYLVEATTDRAVPPTAFVVPGTQTSFRRQAPPATYFVTVAARNACGTSPRSSELTLTVTP